jgi:hypothetical protein
MVEALQTGQGKSIVALHLSILADTTEGTHAWEQEKHG